MIWIGSTVAFAVISPNDSESAPQSPEDRHAEIVATIYSVTKQFVGRTITPDFRLEMAAAVQLKLAEKYRVAISPDVLQQFVDEAIEEARRDP